MIVCERCVNKLLNGNYDIKAVKIWLIDPCEVCGDTPSIEIEVDPKILNTAAKVREGE